MHSKFKHAINGVRVGLVTDRSIRLHVVFGALVVLIGMVLGLSFVEWAVLLLTIFMVVALEYVNSAIEVFANHVHPDQHEAIKKTKDLAAAAVLVASVCALFVGIIIFAPPIFLMLRSI